jgi:hypothetical protein
LYNGKFIMGGYDLETYALPGKKEKDVYWA